MCVSVDGYSNESILKYVCMYVCVHMCRCPNSKAAFDPHVLSIVTAHCLCTGSTGDMRSTSMCILSRLCILDECVCVHLMTAACGFH